MATASRNQERVQVLQAMMDRLCAPDLTLAESKDLCGRLSAMLAGESRLGSLMPEPSRSPVEPRPTLRAVS